MNATPLAAKLGLRRLGDTGAECIGQCPATFRFH